MIYLLFILTGVILGILTGGHIKNYTQFHVSAYFLLLIYFLIDNILGSPGAGILVHQPHGIVILLLFVQYGALFQFIIYNARIRAFLLIGLGEMMNFFVIMANEGRMPVSRLALTGSGNATKLINGEIVHYALITESTRFSYLADRIQISFPQSYLYSLGDLVIMLGLFLLAFQFSRKRTAPSKEADILALSPLETE